MPGIPMRWDLFWPDRLRASILIRLAGACPDMIGEASRPKSGSCLVSQASLISMDEQGI